MPGSSKFRNLVSTKIKNTAHIKFKMEGRNGGHKQMEGAFYLDIVNFFLDRAQAVEVVDSKDEKLSVSVPTTV